MVNPGWEAADHGGDAQQPGRLAGEPDNEPGIEPARGRGHLEPVDEAAEADAGEVRYAITAEGGAFLETLGVIVPPSRRPVRYHADSTEEGLHLSGALGRSLLARFVDLGWLRRQQKQRLQVTPDGLTGFDQDPLLDVLRAVAVGLLDRDD
jgi:hypothetical protein